MAKTVFYSFHYQRDVHRVQLVRNINVLEGQPLLNAQAWEQVQRKGQQAVVDWIDAQMAYKRAVVVLIGQETTERPWVIYEIQQAWQKRKPLLGVRIHGLSSFGVTDSPGEDPFTKAISQVHSVPIFDPTSRNIYGAIDSQATYNQLAQNLESWSGQGRVRW